MRMGSDGKSKGPLEPGTYLIKCVAASSTLNLYRREERQHPVVRHWDTFKSPSERWLVEHGEEGYRFQNVSTGLYISMESHGIKSQEEVLALQNPLEWVVEEKEEGIYQFSEGNS
ncbi:hypothetical protein FRC03_000819 [Tulasnella sp. 419]|nr:hypothetical protein FRC03_000819 [Tulasnella sp. 419]